MFRKRGEAVYTVYVEVIELQKNQEDIDMSRNDLEDKLDTVKKDCQRGKQ